MLGTFVQGRFHDEHCQVRIFGVGNEDVGSYGHQKQHSPSVYVA